MQNTATMYHEQRKATRFKTSIWVKAYSSNKEFSAKIIDLSNGGAALAASFVKPVVGKSISLSSPEHGTWRGKVQWVSSSSIGVMFDRDTQNDQKLRDLLRSFTG